MADRLPIVVLTGGIASGKSAVADMLAELGAAIVDTDELARAVTQPGQPGYEAIVKHWGEDILITSGEEAGTLDRRQLRAQIFAHPTDKAVLESMLHPLIMSKVEEEITNLSMDSTHPYAVVVIPLYVETGATLSADAVVVVDAPKQVQLERLIKRDGIDQALAERMIQAQATREARRHVATHLILNDKDPERLEQSVSKLHQALIKQFSTT